MAQQTIPHVYLDFANISNCDEFSVPTDKHLILNDALSPLCPIAPAVIYSEIGNSVEYIPIIKWLTAGTITVTNDVEVPITNAAIIIRLDAKDGIRVNWVIKGTDTIETLSGATNTYTLRIPDNIVDIVRDSGLAEVYEPTVTLAFLTNGSISKGKVKRISESENEFLCLNYDGILSDDRNVGIYGFGLDHSGISEASLSCQLLLALFIHGIKERPDFIERDFGNFMLFKDDK